jgi:hypothetical protein
MQLWTHHDAMLEIMRTTITFAEDVAAAIERLRKERDLGLSEAVNELIRAGLTVDAPRRPFRQATHDLGLKVDVSNVGRVVDLLDEAEAR